MESQPSISIVTPTLNRRSTFLPAAIASVRALRLTCSYEHIVVDDHSDDDTAAYLAEQAEADPCLRWARHRERRGVAASRNTAARMARGEFLVDLDDDDLLLPNGVELRKRFLACHPAQWAVHANALKIDEQGHYLPGEDVHNWYCADAGRCAELFLTTAMLPNASTAMYRRAALLALGGWDESLSCCEDYELWLRSIERYGPPGFVDDVVALYRKKDHSLGIDSIRTGVHARNQRQVQQRYQHLLALGRAATAP